MLRLQRRGARPPATRCGRPRRPRCRRCCRTCVGAARGRRPYVAGAPSSSRAGLEHLLTLCEPARRADALEPPTHSLLFGALAAPIELRRPRRRHPDDERAARRVRRRAGRAAGGASASCRSCSPVRRVRSRARHGAPETFRPARARRSPTSCARTCSSGSATPRPTAAASRWRALDVRRRGVAVGRRRGRARRSCSSARATATRPPVAAVRRLVRRAALLPHEPALRVSELVGRPAGAGPRRAAAASSRPRDGRRAAHRLGGVLRRAAMPRMQARLLSSDVLATPAASSRRPTGARRLPGVIPHAERRLLGDDEELEIVRHLPVRATGEGAAGEILMLKDLFRGTPRAARRRPPPAAPRRSAAPTPRHDAQRRASRCALVALARRCTRRSALVEGRAGRVAAASPAATAAANAEALGAIAGRGARPPRLAARRPLRRGRGELRAAAPAARARRRLRVERRRRAVRARPARGRAAVRELRRRGALPRGVAAAPRPRDRLPHDARQPARGERAEGHDAWASRRSARRSTPRRAAAAPRHAVAETANGFVKQPPSRVDGDDECPLKALAPHEAFWGVEDGRRHGREPLEPGKHTRPSCTTSSSASSAPRQLGGRFVPAFCAHRPRRARRAGGKAALGFSASDLWTPSARRTPRRRSSSPRRSATCGGDRRGERRALARRAPASVPREMHQLCGTLCTLAAMLGVPTAALGVADADRCAFAVAGALVFSWPRFVARQDFAFWASEVCHAMAHTVSSAHDALHGAVSQALYAYLLPRLQQATGAGVALPAQPAHHVHHHAQHHTRSTTRSTITRASRAVPPRASRASRAPRAAAARAGRAPRSRCRGRRGRGHPAGRAVRPPMCRPCHFASPGQAATPSRGCGFDQRCESAEPRTDSRAGRSRSAAPKSSIAPGSRAPTRGTRRLMDPLWSVRSAKILPQVARVRRFRGSARTYRA